MAVHPGEVSAPLVPSLSPQGHLLLVAGEAAGAVRLEAAAAKRIEKAFAQGGAEGLFHLGAVEVTTPLPAAFAFWRDFAKRFVAELVGAFDIEDRRGAIEVAPPEGFIDSMLRSAPPMLGAEYLSSRVLQRLWGELHGVFAKEITGDDRSVQEFLASKNTAWSGVGRVHFHLAENRGDPEHPFAFLATFTTGLAAHGKAKHRSLGAAVRESSTAKDKDRLLALLMPVQKAAEASEFVRELVESRELFQPLAWTAREAYRLLQEVPALEQSGVIVRLPEWWKNRRPPRPQVTVDIGKDEPTKVGLDALLDFSLRLTLDGEELDEDDLRQLREASEGLVFLKGRWVEVNKAKLDEVLSRWRAAQDRAAEGVSLVDALRLMAGMESEALGEIDRERDWTGIQAGDWLSSTLASLRAEGSEVVPGPDFHAQLRPYQRHGVAWLRFLTQLKLGACLADDMGLGKTVQVLALLTVLKERGELAGPHLLVCPASLIANWRAEAERFAPGLKLFVAHSSVIDPAELGAVSADALSSFDLVITSYGTAHRVRWPQEREWGLVILDEAQAIKNPAIKQSRAVKTLRSRARIALTGTPVENRLGDLWSLFDFLNPGLLGSARQFTQFVKATPSYEPLRNLVKPYILRRLKTDRNVIGDLPEKTEVPAFCGLTRKQAALYQDSVSTLAKKLREVDGIERRGLVLSYLLRFKQICNHPSQWLGDGSYAAEDSGKYARLQELCEVIASRQEKVLVFSQFREMTKPLAHFLTGVFGRPGLVLSGETAVKRRQELVKTFQEDEAVPFFVLSLKAGGTGLNLTAASHVIHFDRWWNPAVENQATDRAFRIGQKRNVLVHKFICRGTVEEKIDALIASKQGMAQQLLEGGGELKLTELSDAALLDLVSLNVRTARGEG